MWMTSPSALFIYRDSDGGEACRRTCKISQCPYTGTVCMVIVRHAELKENIDAHVLGSQAKKIINRRKG